MCDYFEVYIELFGGLVKRKVLIIVQNQSVPPDPRVLNEALSLRANGYEVTVLCPRRKGWPQGYQVLEGIRVYRHPMAREGSTPIGYLWEFGWSLLWELVYTWWIFLRHGFHVIQACNPPDNIFIVALPFKLLGVKFIFDHHDASPELYGAKAGKKPLVFNALLWFERMTYRASDVVIVTNESYKGLATNRGRLNSADVFVVRNGPDPESFKAVTPNPDLKNGKAYLIGYVGCMNAQDGLDILVRVAQHIKALGRRDILFVCAGGGSELPQLRQMVKDLELGDMVRFTGRVPDRELLEILSTADVCVNPDRPCEMNDISTMIKIMEYMSLGKPIVQFESKEGRFSAQEASLYADKVNQVSDFAEKVLWLLDRPEERKKMGDFGRARVEKELAWQHSVGNLLTAYERVFSKESRSNELTREWNGQKTGRNHRMAIEGDDSSLGAAELSEGSVDRSWSHPSYVLITPARNEGAFIEKTIESVIHQTVLPLRWVIVDDGSTDKTSEIVNRFVAQHQWMEIIQMPQRRDRSFSGKVQAFNAAFERIRDLPYNIIGNLDGDISFGRDHFEFLVNKFAGDPRLGVAGTVFSEEGYSSDRDSFEGHSYVAGQCQLFRKQCWEQIGGYTAHRAGGIDWMAVTTARMMGWKTESFRERSFFHHRRLGTAGRGVLASLFSYGEKDYYLGGHPVWELFRVAYRVVKRPYVVGGLALGLGYCWAFVRRTPRPVSRELMAFHRKDQMAKLWAIINSVVRLKKIDNFNVARN